MGSRGVAEVDWLRLGNKQDVGDYGEREMMDDSWAPTCQQVVGRRVNY